MILNRFPLAATLLAAGALLVLPIPARAASDGESPQESENSHTIELKLMARRLMDRVEEHRAHLDRIDKLIRFHRGRGQAEEVRKLEALRQREVESFEQTLAEIHRLLGSQDFERVSKAIRFLGNQATHTEPGETAEGHGTTVREAAVERADVEKVQTSIERTLDRQLMLERARASQRLQLAQRLQAARDHQLRLIAQQQRRFQPPAATATTRDRGANAGGAAANGRRQAEPYKRP